MPEHQRGGPRRGAGPAAARPPSQRQLRVGEELRHVLVGILRDSHARDPELQNINVTVTEVRASPDLKHATAYVTPFGYDPADKARAAETIAALNRGSAYFRSRIAQAIALRHAPRISFALDTSFGYAERIESLLRSAPVMRDLGVETPE